MLTLNIDCEVKQDRVVTFKLPETVPPGRHELVVVIDEIQAAPPRAISDAGALMRFADSVAAFDRADGVSYQRKARAEWN